MNKYAKGKKYQITTIESGPHLNQIPAIPPPIDVTKTKKEGAAGLQQIQKPIRIGVPDESQSELRWVNRKEQVWYTS